MTVEECWIATAVVYLLAETIAAAEYPGYSYAENYISDLGVPVESPASLVMNAGFVLHGAPLATAALLTARYLPQHRGIVAIAVVTGVGNILIGLVALGAARQRCRCPARSGCGAGDLRRHLTAIVGGPSLRRVGRRGVGVACLALGLTGLLTAGAWFTHRDLLADGTWERLAVYAITAVELLLGAALLRRPPA